MTFLEFKKLVTISWEEICREIFHRHGDRIRIKKEDKVVENLMKIFNATLAISNRKGFQAMSMRDLSRESGLSMGALYSYVPGKEDLVELIQTQGTQTVFHVLTGQIAGTEGTREKLRRAIQTHIYLSEVMQPWFYFSYMEAKNLTREQQKEAIEGELFTERVFTELFEEGNREGVFAVANPLLASSAVKALLQDWYLKRWKYRQRKITVDDYSRFVIEFIESYINPERKRGG